MHLTTDYIHPYKSAGGRPARCRVRIYLPDDVRAAPGVICSQLPAKYAPLFEAGSQGGMDT